MAPQTTYLDQGVGFPAVKGGLADAGVTNKVSRHAAAAINFGLGVVVTANEDEVALPSSTGFIFAGVALMKHNITFNATAVALYSIGDAISVLRKGRVWVNSEVAVDPTKDVYLRHTANTGPTRSPGDFLVTADTNKADQIANAKWVSVTSGAGLAILEVNMP
jgi:hypothetical protein